MNFIGELQFVRWDYTKLRVLNFDINFISFGIRIELKFTL